MSGALLLTWECAIDGCDRPVGREGWLCRSCGHSKFEADLAEEVRRQRLAGALWLELGDDAFAHLEGEWQPDDDSIEWLTAKLTAAADRLSADGWRLAEARNLDQRALHYRQVWLLPAGRWDPSAGTPAPITFGPAQLWLARALPWPVRGPLLVAAYRTMRWWHRKRYTGWPENLWPDDLDEWGLGS